MKTILLTPEQLDEIDRQEDAREARKDAMQGFSSLLTDDEKAELVLSDIVDETMNKMADVKCKSATYRKYLKYLIHVAQTHIEGSEAFPGE